MTAPDKIYVHKGAHLGMLTLTTISVDAPGEEIYIRKDALLEWLEQEVLKLDVRSDNDAVAWGQRNSFKQVIDILNSMRNEQLG